MLISDRTQKTIFKILTVLLLAGMALVIFHHHADGQHTNDCAVCRLAAQIFCIVLTASLFIARALLVRFPALATKTFFSLLLTPNLLGRAPPSFS